MQLRGISMVACLIVGAAFGQTLQDALRLKLTSVHYAPLAEQARIQGDVRLNVNGDVITVVSRHPLLAQTAVESARAFRSVQSQPDFDVTYHFVLVDTTTSVPIVTTVKRGNAFERSILRVLGRKTERVVHEYRCEEGVAPANDVKMNDTAIEVWIYGRTRCLQPSMATLVARR